MSFGRDVAVGVCHCKKNSFFHTNLDWSKYIYIYMENHPQICLWDQQNVMKFALSYNAKGGEFYSKMLIEIAVISCQISNILKRVWYYSIFFWFVLSYEESNTDVRSRNSFNPLNHGGKYVCNRTEHFIRPCNGSDIQQLPTQKAWDLSQPNPGGFIVIRVALGQVFLGVLQFPHLVSFHQYPILIHSSNPETIYPQ
jgi:hypothetical protein